MLYKFQKVVPPRCYFCMKEPEISVLLFDTCTKKVMKEITN